MLDGDRNEGAWSLITRPLILLLLCRAEFDVSFVVAHPRGCREVGESNWRPHSSTGHGNQWTRIACRFQHSEWFGRIVFWFSRFFHRICFVYSHCIQFGYFQLNTFKSQLSNFKSYFAKGNSRVGSECFGAQGKVRFYSAPCLQFLQNHRGCSQWGLLCLGCWKQRRRRFPTLSTKIECPPSFFRSSLTRLWGREWRRLVVGGDWEWRWLAVFRVKKKSPSTSTNQFRSFDSFSTRTSSNVISSNILPNVFCKVILSSFTYSRSVGKSASDELEKGVLLRLKVWIFRVIDSRCWCFVRVCRRSVDFTLPPKWKECSMTFASHKKSTLTSTPRFAFGSFHCFCFFHSLFSQIVCFCLFAI